MFVKIVKIELWIIPIHLNPKMLLIAFNFQFTYEFLFISMKCVILELSV